MGDIDSLIEQMQRQLQTYGLSEAKGELKQSLGEVQGILEFLQANFLQDFRYDNVQPVLSMLRAARGSISDANRAFGSVEGAIANAAHKIRNA